MSEIIILLHGSAQLHLANLMKATVGWEVMNHCFYNTDIALSDFHVFGSVKVHVGGQISD
jgi:hypothetical protein